MISILSERAYATFY